MSKIIYFCSPYTHADKEVVESRYLKTATAIAKLISEGHVVISPIVYGHNLLKYHDMPSDWEFWKNFCRSFLEKCEEMIVYKLDGWDKSTGIAGEIEFAKSLGITVKYMDV